MDLVHPHSIVKGKGIGHEKVVEVTPKLLIALFLLAFSARLLWVFFFKDLGIGLDDMYQYDMLARSLASGNGFRWYSPDDIQPLAVVVGINPGSLNVPPEGLVTTFRAPLYPLFLAMIYIINGFTNRFFAARLVQAILGAMLAPLTTLLAKRIGVSAKGAALAGLIIVIYPLLTFYPLGLASENLFFILLLTGVILVLRAAKSGRIFDYVIAGIILGLATLTRSIIVLTLPFISIWLWKYGANRIRGLILLNFMVMLLILPWSIRNSLIAGKPTFIETSLNYNLFIGYHPDSDGLFRSNIAIIPLHIVDDTERDHWCAEQAFAFIKTHPERIPTLIINKWNAFWGLEKRELIYFYSNGFFGSIPLPLLLLSALIFFLPFIILITLCIPGIVFAPASAERMLVLLVVGAYVTPHLFILAENRFHLAIVPLLCAYAGHAWDIRREISARSPSRGRIHCIKHLEIIVALAIFFMTWSFELLRDWNILYSIFMSNGWRLGLSY